MNQLDLLNSNKLDDSIMNAIGQMTPNFEYSSSADGEDEAETENEENTDYEESDAAEAGGVDEQDLPKFRQLVKQKKLEYKAKYGKARLGKKKKCTNVPYPCPTWKNPLKKCDKKVCVDVPAFFSGWRKEWRKFKQQGGLAQLKQQAKGLAPIPSATPASTPPQSGSVATGTKSSPKTKPFKNVGKADVSQKGETRKGELTDDLSEDSDGKILGMSKPVAALVGVALLVGSVIVYKKFIKK